MAKTLTFILIVVLSFTIALPAKAFTCRSDNGHKICILSIKRSAKKYWQYQASVSIDGAKTPVETYDCRQHRIQNDGKIIPFGEDNAGALICSFFKNA
ncbi:hypothetical protein DSM106972_023840 [Dulcicalothrix desertica PCC 7102]|uniref:Uncharacterized protein n=1 Tax=Dulcicalothrix desertica PCC 7102 TaxID=232991 RepID=A0A433VLU6_9CYAN|nr:hypothetical protein [Dulcicalothrix desertica]RUT07123.1 hypothetical protein DSM106972_023840 [Dulcicalothrix desertica PCC 7102]TWH61880.1 hypothetical protein CAL7102_00559 [Dulcicalothrix desertica PCC 7102]